MTIEQKIVELLEESTALNQYFQGAKSQIESALSAAIAAAPSLAKTFYVDAVSGSDENSGLVASKFKTVDKAVNSVPSGGVGVIYLTNGQDYVIESSVDITNKTILIRGTDGLDRPRLKNKSDAQNITTGFYGYNGKVRLFLVDLYSADFGNPLLSRSAYDGIFKGSSQSDLDVLHYSGNFYIGDTSLFSQYAGQKLNITMHYVTIYHVASNEQGKLLYNRADTVTRLSAGTVTLPEGSVWGDLISGISRAPDNEPRNILTNLEL